MKLTLLPIAISFLSGCIFVEDDSCVADGALVSTPQGLRAIESLRVGDLVWAVDLRTGERIPTPITKIRTATRECLALQLGERALQCTPDHPVYSATSKTFVPAIAFLQGEAREVLVVDDQGSRVEPVQAVRTDVGLRRVFDLTVASEHHNFVANGVLVHNKSEACYVTGGQPACDEGPGTLGSTASGTESSGTVGETEESSGSQGTAATDGTADGTKGGTAGTDSTMGTGASGTEDTSGSGSSTGG